MIDGTDYEGRTWQFPTIAGQEKKAARIRWDQIGDEPFSLYDPGSGSLLEECKCFVWTMLFDRATGKPLSYGGLARLSLSLGSVVTWMLESGLTSFSQITNQRSWTFLEWFRDNHSRPSNGKTQERQFSWSSAWCALKVIYDIFEESDVLRARGIEAISEPPFDGRTPHDLVNSEYGLRKGDKLDPIPDHIALPVLAEAAKWVSERADDVLRLEAVWLEEVVPFEKSNERTARFRAILRNFEVSADPETGQPWVEIGGAAGWTRTDADGGVRIVTAGHQPRRLVSDLLSACITVVLGMTGMRASDINSVRVEPDQDFPSCVTSKRSLDGLIEYFLLEGVEQKSSHERHSWVLGARLVGTAEYPLPVKALIVISRLLNPYRKANNLKNLILRLSGSKSLALSKVSTNTTSSWITDTQREFATNYANVPIRAHERNLAVDDDRVAFRSAQWRDTFAIYVVRTNKRALGPLATHFNHVNTMMTELGYIGNDPDLLRLVDDARVSLATNTIAELVDGDGAVGGGLAALLKDAINELRTDLGDAEVEERLERIRGVVVDYGVRLFFTDYGICGVGVVPAVARCHQAVGDESTTNRFPNFATRRPALCVGCRNFLVNKANLAWWEQRVSDLEKTMPAPGEDRHWPHRRQLALARHLVNALKEAPNGRSPEKTVKR